MFVWLISAYKDLQSREDTRNAIWQQEGWHEVVYYTGEQEKKSCFKPDMVWLTLHRLSWDTESLLGPVINIKWTLNYDDTTLALNLSCFLFLQFLSFSIWIPGSWSRQRLPRCSKMRSELEAEIKWHHFESYMNREHRSYSVDDLSVLQTSLLLSCLCFIISKMSLGQSR